MPQILVNLYLGRVGETAKEVQQRVQTAIGQHLNFIEASLGADYLAGSDFTAADIQMSFPVEVAATQRFLNDNQPRLRAWLSRLHSRPAYQRALEAGGPYAYAS
jgi:glutathione S-transferase